MLDIYFDHFGLLAATLQPNTYVTTANNVELDPFRPFGSNRPCSELLNVSKNDFASIERNYISS